MKKMWLLPVVFLIIVLFVAHRTTGGRRQIFSSVKEEAQTNQVDEEAKETLKKEEIPQEMKALLIIAKNNFRDEEYIEPREILEANGVEIVVASSSLDTAKGTLGMMVEPDILIDDVNVADYDAIVFVGGAGADEYYDNPQALSIAKESAESGKVLGAICIAPVTLANAGVLNGKKATVFSSKIADLEAKGVIYVSDNVVQDGNIITACGPHAASAFGQAVLDAMKK
ncbi:DJ-1/PfpI family protein [Candidatus Oleimmundimicrobium sp.]|uniref:DJ-1/PfpI family protein n=1 Tax=Candidatus Oleimmundimicrobium sp. TaxID=3060597 RepID=UPI0027176690|nr:DJ-1/PfpI family protein [Candidatus Oleimmundimicrobium sp.]MDO8886858.1 DJ-1/PfpI family protein [Candidatus Oleimmundimicrobium sp.]